MSKVHFGKLAALSLGAAVWSGAAQAEFELHVLHINDLHSRIEPVNKYNATCSADEDALGECFGGVARLATALKETREALLAEGANVLTLDAGDQFQGSLMYTNYKGAVEAEFMTAIGFDAMAVGNHEFDDGPVKLADFIAAVPFPVISGNIDVSGEPVLAGQVQEQLILEVGGEKIAIVSALATDTMDTSSPGPNVRFVDEVVALSEDVAALEEQGIDKILALTHVGLNRDIEIAAEVPGIDAVIGGHSHTYLNSDDPDAAGPYPVMAGAVPVVQAGAYSRYLGHLVLVFDDAGQVVSATGGPIVLGPDISPDPAIAARVAELAAPLEELKAELVGEAADLIDGDRDACRMGECAMGNLVADAMLERVRDQGITIAITNGGGLRASINPGEITMGEVLTVLPFQNTLSTFSASGMMIIDGLENGVSQVEDMKGRFPQIAGMRFSWDPDAGPNEGRIVSVELASGGEWVPIDPEATYGVVTNNYVRRGGDGYRMFAAAEEAYDFGPGLDRVLADYLSALNGPYTPYTDGRITRLE
ncbi:MAG: 5'-nucleotidase C-terminal domain-containing protein [Mangrovicoccus sp.]|nr:5'-nucleotidase C-terminal domain-containing protein [Mangrovicoccus sp.]